MASLPPVAPRHVQRRCQHCGTRVVQDADSCFMCGRSLLVKGPRWPRLQLPNISTVVIVVLVGILSWQFFQPGRDTGEVEPTTEVIMPPTLEAPTPVPTPTGTATPWPTATSIPPTPEPYRHEVSVNESLWSIAALYEVELDELRTINNLTSDTLNPGQLLEIPGKEQSANTVSPESGIISTVNFTYEVQAGDNIISLAYRFGTTPDEILIANGLSPDVIINKGQVLVIPIPRLSQEVLVSSDLAPRTSNPIFPGPRLLGPANGALISRRNPILFHWLSVDILAPNEWYVLRIWPRAGEEFGPPTVWTKATSHLLDSPYAEVEEGNQEFLWQVTVVRVVAPSIQSGPRELQSASLSSDIRQFTWQ